jgi:hypothetical protein
VGGLRRVAKALSAERRGTTFSLELSFRRLQKSRSASRLCTISPGRGLHLRPYVDSACGFAHYGRLMECQVNHLAAGTALNRSCAPIHTLSRIESASEQQIHARPPDSISMMSNSSRQSSQIIGCGTRLYDGKDYFTIYDFVKAYRHFSDPEWDGEPQEPEPCTNCAFYPCECPRTPPQPCAACGRRTCECPKEPCESIDHMMNATFWHPDGTPMSAQEFMEHLFGKEVLQGRTRVRALPLDPCLTTRL